MNKYAVRWVVGTIVAFLMVVLFASSWPKNDGAEVAEALVTMQRIYHQRREREPNLYCYRLDVRSEAVYVEIYTVVPSLNGPPGVLTRHWASEEWARQVIGWHIVSRRPIRDDVIMYADKNSQGKAREFTIIDSQTRDCNRGLWRYASHEMIEDWHLPCDR